MLPSWCCLLQLVYSHSLVVWPPLSCTHTHTDTHRGTQRGRETSCRSECSAPFCNLCTNVPTNINVYMVHTYKRYMYVHARVKYVYNMHMYVCRMWVLLVLLQLCRVACLCQTLPVYVCVCVCVNACRRLSEVSLIAGSAVASGLCTIRTIHLQICLYVCTYRAHVQYVRMFVYVHTEMFHCHFVSH